MGLNINLFVHGVPMGQKMWGTNGDDQLYLSSFYGLKWEVPEVMKVDVMTSGGIPYCYYSLVKGLNVCDSQGRAGSYFALTLRINAFYCDVQNIYSVLKAAYEKMCIGLCVQENNDVIKYLIADFQNADAQLKAIESHIINYISEFSVNEDVVSLSGFSANAEAATPKVNLHECSKRVALEYGKRYGKLMVSPFFLSASAANTVAKYKAETDETKRNAQEEIKRQERLFQEQIDSVKKRCQEDIRRLQDKAKTENRRKKNEYSSSQGTDNAEQRKNLFPIDGKLFAILVGASIVVFLIIGCLMKCSPERKVENKDVKQKTSKTSETKDSMPTTIYITTLDGREITEVECGIPYNLNLKGAEAGEGKWQGLAFGFEGEKIIARRDSVGKTCKITYVSSNGEEIASTNVKIIEKK